MSNIDRVGPPAVRERPPMARPLTPRDAPPSSGDNFPSAAGTAVLNLTGDQLSRIRALLVGMRRGKHDAKDVREGIFALLSGGQRRVLGAAWFILSVRV